MNKLSEFPDWIKETIYRQLGEELSERETPAYIFASYKPILTYKGKCEADFKTSSFDTNIYNILSYSDKNFSISEIMLNTYLSMEEVASYFLLCLDEGYFEIPDDSRILNIAGFIAGKYKTGEYFLKNGNLSETQLNTVINSSRNEENKNKKFGQILIDYGFINKSQLNSIISIKNEAKKRFVLDYNEIPTIKQEYTDNDEKHREQIAKLQNENKILKTKLEQLLTMVKNND